MATMDTNALRLVDQGLAVPYVVALWMGIPKDEICAGLRNGTVAPPVGEAANYSPKARLTKIYSIRQTN